MNITNNNISKNNTSFQGYTPKHVVSFYRQIDKEFINNARQKGIGKSALLAIIERMAQNPKFESRTFNDIIKELSQKIQYLIETIDNSNNIDELKNVLKLPLETISTLLYKRQQAKRNEAIAEAYNNCKNIEKVAQKFQLKTNTIEQILRSQGISLNTRIEKTAQAIKMLKEGATRKEVAETIGLNTATVQAIGRREQIPTMREFNAALKQEQIINALKAGKSHRDIAIEFKKNKCEIDALAKELGFVEKVSTTSEAILKKLENRKGLMQIAQELSITIPEALKQARKLGFTPKDARELREKAILETLKTKSVPATAKEFGVGITTIYNIKRKYQI